MPAAFLCLQLGSSFRPFCYGSEPDRCNASKHFNAAILTLTETHTEYYIFCFYLTPRMYWKWRTRWVGRNWYHDRFQSQGVVCFTRRYIPVRPITPSEPLELNLSYRKKHSFDVWLVVGIVADEDQSQLPTLNTAYTTTMHLVYCDSCTFLTFHYERLGPIALLTTFYFIDLNCLVNGLPYKTPWSSKELHGLMESASITSLNTFLFILLFQNFCITNDI